MTTVLHRVIEPDKLFPAVAAQTHCSFRRLILTIVSLARYVLSHHKPCAETERVAKHLHFQRNPNPRLPYDDNSTEQTYTQLTKGAGLHESLRLLTP